MITSTNEIPSRFSIGPHGVQGFLLVQTGDGAQVFLDIEGIDSAEDVGQSNSINQQPSNTPE